MSTSNSKLNVKTTRFTSSKSNDKDENKKSMLKLKRKKANETVDKKSNVNMKAEEEELMTQNINPLNNLLNYNPTCSFLSSVVKPPTISNGNTNNNYDSFDKNENVIFVNKPAKPSNINSSSSNLDNLINNTKIKTRKLMFPEPPSPNVNFIGIIIGTKGTFLKRLEILSKCKIKLRGKGTCKDKENKEVDSDPTHAVIESESEINLNKAQILIERILTADTNILEQLKEEQIKEANFISQDNIMKTIYDPAYSEQTKTIRKILLNEQKSLSINELDLKSDQENENDKNSSINYKQEELHLVSPYGRPSSSAKTIPVPNESVSLLIGRNGDTIKKLIKDSGCKILIALKEIPNTETRNLFVEGENFEIAKKMIEEIVAHHQKVRLNMSHIGDINPFPGPYVLVKIPNDYVGLVIGKSGETVKKILSDTGCSVFIPNKNKPYYDDMVKLLKILGTNDSITFTANNKPKFPFDDESNNNIHSNEDNNQEIPNTTNLSNSKSLKSKSKSKELKKEEVSKGKFYTYSRAEILKFYNAREYKESNTRIKKNEQYRIIELSSDKEEAIAITINKIQQLIVRLFLSL